MTGSVVTEPLRPHRLVWDGMQNRRVVDTEFVNHGRSIVDHVGDPRDAGPRYVGSRQVAGE